MKKTLRHSVIFSEYDDIHRAVYDAVITSAEGNFKTPVLSSTWSYFDNFMAVTISHYFQKTYYV